MINPSLSLSLSLPSLFLSACVTDDWRSWRTRTPAVFAAARSLRLIGPPAAQTRSSGASSHKQSRSRSFSPAVPGGSAAHRNHSLWHSSNRYSLLTHSLYLFSGFYSSFTSVLFRCGGCGRGGISVSSFMV